MKTFLFITMIVGAIANAGIISISCPFTETNNTKESVVKCIEEKLPLYYKLKCQMERTGCDQMSAEQPRREPDRGFSGMVCNFESENCFIPFFNSKRKYEKCPSQFNSRNLGSSALEEKGKIVCIKDSNAKPSTTDEGIKPPTVK